jgi:hypothetical protein
MNAMVSEYYSRPSDVVEYKLEDTKCNKHIKINCRV